MGSFYIEWQARAEVSTANTNGMQFYLVFFLPLHTVKGHKSQKTAQPLFTIRFFDFI